MRKKEGDMAVRTPECHEREKENIGDVSHTDMKTGA